MASDFLSKDDRDAAQTSLWQRVIERRCTCVHGASSHDLTKHPFLCTLCDCKGYVREHTEPVHGERR